jgi:hypothetical protein
MFNWPVGLFVFMPVPGCFNNYGFVIYFETRIVLDFWLCSFFSRLIWQCHINLRDDKKIIETCESESNKDSCSYKILAAFWETECKWASLQGRLVI